VMLRAPVLERLPGSLVPRVGPASLMPGSALMYHSRSQISTGGWHSWLVDRTM
jgi:hypothetical protein